MNAFGVRPGLVASVMEESEPLMANNEREQEANDMREAEEDEFEGSFGKRFSKLLREFTFTKNLSSITNSDISSQDSSAGFYVRTDSTAYALWWKFMVIACVYSSMFAPLEFGFYRGLPRRLWIFDLLVQVVFVMDILLRFFTAYKDTETYLLIVDNRSIALRYLKGSFFIEFLACWPWDTIYKVTGRKEEMRYLLWLRLYRVWKVDELFNRLEKDIRLNYFATRIVRLLVVEMYCVHTAACIFHYLAVTMDPSEASYTWLGSLVQGSFSYADFRDVDLGKRYATSLYFAIITMTTVGYGDVHGVNVREMIFIMIYASFNMILSAYLLGNMTALIVKGSATERFRDKMAGLVNFMNKHRLPPSIKEQMRNHVLMEFEEDTLAEEEVVGSLPSTVRSKVAHSLYGHVVHAVQIFKGCSGEFLDEIIGKVVEEHFLPGEVVVQQGGASDQFYIVCRGVLEEILVHEDGKVEIIEEHRAEGIFGEVGVLCNIPQPFSVRVTELCRLLRLDKHSFHDLVQIYFNDGRILINNLLEWKDTDARIGQIAADVTFMVAKHAAELALMVNNASFQGDLPQLKHLVKQGAIIARADYDGRTALHLAASKGFEAVVLFLIREDADINAIDKFGISPLLEAVKGGHDHCIQVLLDQGAQLHLLEPGSYLCNVVNLGNSDLLRRLLHAGADPSAFDYDRRTPLHIAAAIGDSATATMLVEAGADVSLKDRWGRTPLEEAVLRNHSEMIPILTDAAQKRRAGRAYHARHPRRTVSTHYHHHHNRDRGASGGSSATSDPESTVRGGNLMSQASGDSSAEPRRRLQHQHSTPALQRENSNERRAILLGLGSSTPAGRRHSSGGGTDIGSDNAMHRYRVMPVRRKGRHHVASTEQPSLAATRSARRRVTYFPFHPFAPSNTRESGGRVDWVPPNVQAILQLAHQHFGKEGTKILNKDAGEIASTDLIMDSEKVFVVDDEDVRNYSSLIKAYL